MSVLVKSASLYADLADTSSNRSSGCNWTSNKAKATRFPDADRAVDEMARRNVADFSIEDEAFRRAIAA
jgi:hypothetical protein